MKRYGEDLEEKKIERYAEIIVAKKMGFDLSAIKKYEKGQVYMQGEYTGIADIDKALKEAGGKPEKCKLWEKGGEGLGKAQPEYIVTFDKYKDYVIVVECKSSVKMHESGNTDSPKGYAVDGVLYYAKFLKKYFNTIAIAFSGSSEDTFEMTCFLWPKQENNPYYIPEGRIEFHEPEWYVKEAKRVYKEEQINKEKYFSKKT